MEFGTSSRRARVTARGYRRSFMVNLNGSPNGGLESARRASVTMIPQRINPTRQRHSSASSSNGVSNSSVIDLEDIEDEIQMLSFSRGFPEATTRRSRPVTLILDEDLDSDSRRSGLLTNSCAEESIFILSSSDHIRKERSTRYPTVIDCELYPDPEDTNVKGKNPMRSGSDPPEAPTFTCPVCMNQLVDASSTICGHIFCKSCIITAIQKQQKCPTCRQKLNTIDFHRVYLPTTN